MRFTLSIFLLAVFSMAGTAQPTGYYNGTEGKTGDDLKTTLNQIIDDHVAYSYFAAKTIMKFSDADPTNPENVILVYTGRSQANNDYGNGNDQINREHVWAKSHGDFADLPPMYGDVHNLKPADKSVNTDKSNKDFDNGGTQHPEATGCYYTGSTWEARDEVKGDIARIIFYMDARYEGTNGEIDLTVVDEINTYPLPEHGKLSTLLEWNMQDPPDDFERNRNDVIFSWQKNRNPFIDNPEYAELIWGNQTLSPISFGNFSNTPANPVEGDVVTIVVDVTSTTGSISNVSLKWGTSYNNLGNTITMTSVGNSSYQAQVPGQNGTSTIYFQVEASAGTTTESSIIYNYYVAPVFNGNLTSIYDIQGQTEDSPYAGQVVSTAGVVTANFGEDYFIQDGSGAWNGLFIYDPGRNPSIGDSVIVTGKIEEYYNKTELKEVSAYYHISSNNALPAAALIESGAGGEQWESVLVKVSNAICTDDEYQSNFYMWKINDGSGVMLVHNTSIFEFEPVLGESYDVSGPLNYDFDEWKIEIRLESDVQPGVDVFPPEVENINPVNDNLINVVFTEDVTAVSATDVNNYSLTNDVTVQSIQTHSFLGNIVFLTVSKMSTGDYTLTINNVEDPSGNKMDNIETDFYYESTGIEKLESIKTLTITPNPASSDFNILYEAVENDKLRLEVFDLSGKKVHHQIMEVNVGNNAFAVSNQGLMPGIYMVKLSDEHAFTIQKLIIQ